MPKKLLMFDSNDGTKNYDGNAADVKYYHPYNILFTLPSPILNVRRILLKSVEMPLALPNIRNVGTMNLFNVGWYSGGYNVSHNARITPYFYPSFTLLNNAITSVIIQMSLIYDFASINVSFSTTTNSIGLPVCLLTHNAVTFTINDSYFMNVILGFASGTYNYSPIYGTAAFNLFPDTHLYLYISNIQSNNSTLKQATFKIPLLNGYATTPLNLFYSDSIEHQFIDGNNDNFLLDKVNIIVNDKMGFPVTGYLNWSFSLIVDYEENDNKTEFLNLEY